MRTRFKFASKDPLVALPSARNARQPIDNKRNSKKARLTDTGLDSPNDRDASRRHGDSEFPRSDAPKTSEYAYFRNIKNRTATANSGSLHEDRDHSKSLKRNHLSTEHSKSSKRNHLSTETVSASGFYKSATEDLRISPVSEARTGPSNHHTLFLPRMINVPHDADLTYKSKPKSPLHSVNATPIIRHLSLSPFQKASEISGNQCSKQGIFSAKRQKLRQWVVRTSFSKVQDSVPKGSDLVASLLSRLFPKNDDSSAVNSNNSRSLPFNETKYLEKGRQLPYDGVDGNLPRICSNNTISLPFNEPKYLEWAPQSTHGRNPDAKFHIVCSGNSRSFPYNEPKYLERGPHCRNPDENLHRIWSDNNSRSLAFNEPAYPEMGPQLPHGRNLDQNLPGIFFGSSTDIVHSGQDTFVSRYPSLECGSEYTNERDIMDPIPRLNSRQSRDSHRLLDFSFGLPIERYESSHAYLGEQEDCSLVGRASEEPHRPLLEWDPESQRRGAHSSKLNCDISENLNPCLAIPWHDDYHRLVDNWVDANTLCSSFLPSNHCVEFNQTPNFKSPSSLIKDVEPNFEHLEYVVEEPDQFSSTLPYTSCLSLVEHRKAEDTMYSINDMFAWRNQNWLKNEVWDWDSKSRTDSWQKFLYATEISEDPSSTLCTRQFPQSEIRLSSSPWLHDTRGEGVALSSAKASNSHIFPSNYQESLEASLDSFIDYPSLITNFSSRQCGKDLYFDDVNRFEYAQLH